jgi:hypothetical protein
MPYIGPGIGNLLSVLDLATKSHEKEQIWERVSFAVHEMRE